MKSKRFKLLVATACIATLLSAQTGTEQAFKTWAQTPPMGWNSWDWGIHFFDGFFSFFLFKKIFLPHFKTCGILIP